MSATGPVRTIDVAEAARQLGVEGSAGAGSPLLVDVREANEFATVRVPGSVLLPLSDLASRYAELPRDRPLLVMCAAGKRSFVAAEHLVRNGYDDVVSVDGGIVDWQRAGYPTRVGAPAPGEGALPDG